MLLFVKLENTTNMMYNSPEFDDRQRPMILFMLAVFVALSITAVKAFELDRYFIILLVNMLLVSVCLAIVAIRGKLLVWPEFRSLSEWLLGIPVVTITKLFSPFLWCVCAIYSLIIWGVFS